MSKRMKGSLPYLQVMGKCGPKLRKFMINNVPAEVITAICECSLNLLKGVIPVTPRQKRRLARYKTHLRDLASKKVSRKRKKQRLNKKGGNLLSALLPPVLSVLGSLSGKHVIIMIGLISERPAILQKPHLLMHRKNMY